MSEQQGTILIEHVSAGPEVARGSPSDMGVPHAGDSWTIEPFAATVRSYSIRRHQAKASRVTLGNIQNRFSQRLKNGARRIGQRADQRHERAILLFIIGRARRAAAHLLRAEDRL